MRKIIVIITILLLSITYKDFCYATGVHEERAGDVRVELSAPPELGKVVTFTATFTPLYDADDCEVRFSTKEGIEILEEGAYFDRGISTNWFIYKKGEIKKGETFSMSIKIRAIRPGVWSIGAGFDYMNVPGKWAPYISGNGFWAVISEEGANVYGDERVWVDKEKGYCYYRPLVPLEAWYIPSKIVIKYPTGNTRVREVNGKKEIVTFLTKEPRLDFEPTYQFEVSYNTSGYSAPLPISPDLPDEEKWKQIREIKKELSQKAKPRSKLIWKVIGNIGTIDEQGLFTATRFGKGKIRVEHGKWLSDEIDVEVVPHPNPSPPDKIIDVIVVPYDMEEEKEYVDKVLKEYKGKRFRSRREAHIKFNPKGAFKVKRMPDKNWYAEDVIEVVEGTRKKLKAVAISSGGELIEKDFKFNIPSQCDILTMEGNGIFRANKPGICEISAYTYIKKDSAEVKSGEIRIEVIPKKTKE